MSRTQLALGGAAALALFYWYSSRSGSQQSETLTFKKAAGGGAASSAAPGVAIYFGSQTGTAEAFATELVEKAHEHGENWQLIDMDDFDEEAFARHELIVLVVATYGEGDPTDNAVEMINALEDLGNDLELGGKPVAVFGLGNRTYVNFNAVSRQVEKALIAKGAKPICARGEGDDDRDIEADFAAWQEAFWPAVTALRPAMRAASSEGEALTAEKVLQKLQLVADVAPTPQQLQPRDVRVATGGADTLGKWIFHSHQAVVKATRELRQQPDAAKGLTTYHLDLDISTLPQLVWQTADNVEVLAENAPELVDFFLKRLRHNGAPVERSHTLQFRAGPGAGDRAKLVFPTPCTVEHALRLFTDLNAVPTKVNLHKLAAFVPDGTPEAEALRFLLRDAAAWHLLVGPKSQFKLSYKELWMMFFNAAEVPLHAFLQLSSRQKYREYTISSSRLVDKATIGVTVSVVRDELRPLPEARFENNAEAAALLTVLAAAGKRREHWGVASTCMCVRAPPKLRIGVHSSSFRLPRDVSLPVVMIGAGTGIAPFRAFVQERQQQRVLRPQAAYGPFLLFFGCTHAERDYLYKDELEAAQAAGVVEVVGAFSRMQAEKVYVQHKVHERGAQLKAMLQDRGTVMICGANTMGAAVAAAFDEILQDTELDVATLQKRGKYIEELWG